MNKSIIISIYLFIGFASSNIFSEKAFPPSPKPVSFKGVIYKAEKGYFNIDSDSYAVGLIKAIDLKSNKELWLKDIYKIKLDNQIEGDVQIIVITDIQIDSVKNELIIKNEAGDIYRVNLQNYDVYQSDGYAIEQKLKMYCPVCPNCEKKPIDAPSVAKRGNFYFDQNKYPWAKTYYERAIKTDSNYAPAHLGLAKVAKVMKDASQYRIELEKAKMLAPNDSEVIYETKFEKKAKN